MKTNTTNTPLIKKIKHMEIIKKINPQPLKPVIAFFWGNDDGDESRWYYQAPKEVSPGSVFNKTMPFDDPNQPGKPGDLYNGETIEKVKVRHISGCYCWVINTKI